MGFFSKKIIKSGTKKVSVQPIYFFNTLSKTKEIFRPLQDGKVGIYTCGPTVYNYAHIGNLRTYAFGDTLRRVLAYNGYDVTHVMNVTDIGHLTGDDDSGDDKMTVGLKRECMPITLGAMRKLGDKYASALVDDMNAMHMLSPNEIPHASDHLPEQIAYIDTLEQKGYIYKTSDGLYFDTEKFPDYGALSKDSTASKEHSRIGENKDKHRAEDFALWKFNSEIGFESPWGKGFPGWHIECTAMSTKYLGKTFDIHTGGIDLAPIHHNNEIAQTESATGKPFVNYFLHVAFLNMEGTKISKSLGNEVVLRNIIDRGFSPLAYRYWLLTAHYRSTVNFTWEALGGAQTTLFKLHRYFVEDLGKTDGNVIGIYEKRFHDAINDDLDTPKALVVLHELTKDTDASKKDVRATFLAFDSVLGLGFDTSSKKLLENLSGEQKLSVDALPVSIKKLVASRKKAREEKNWEKADEIRDKLKEKGYSIEDGADGIIVKKS